MAYANSSDVKLELVDVLSGSFKYDSLIDSLVSIASDYIDDLHGHEHGAFALGATLPTATARLYNGSGRSEQVIGECVSIGLVELSFAGSWVSLTSTDWYRSPINSTPYTGLTLNPYGTYDSIGKDVANVRVTAVWGYSQIVPGIIKQIAITQVVRWIKRAQNAFADVSANVELGQLQYLQELDPEIKAAIINARMARVTI